MTRSIRSSIPRWAVRAWDFISLQFLSLWDWTFHRFNSKPECRGPQVAYTSGKSHRLGIRPYRAIVSASCTASVLRSLHLYFSGQTIGQSRAIELMRCRRTGAPLCRIAHVLRRRLHCRSRQLRTAHQIQAALRRGSPVLGSDDWTYAPDGHAILVTGYTPQGFWTIDPADGSHRWRSKRRLLAASDEFIAITSE